MQEIKQAITQVVQEAFGEQVEIELTRPDEKFGDYATNVALQLAAKIGQPPRQIAEAITAKLSGHDFELTIEGPGFLNIRLTNQHLIAMVNSATDLPKPFSDQEILVEFGDPNPFKEMHIGHLYSYIVGDSISRLLEGAGATVRRLSYHGDVGLHVAKAIWGMQKEGITPESTVSAIKNNMGHYYALGAQAYESDQLANKEIQDINEHIYKKDDDGINSLYDWGRQKSLGYFREHLKDLGIQNDRQYFESETAEIGIATVKQNIGSVFKESEGAIIYDGEKAGLHTRVFITSKALPTYETKDLGLVELKNRDFPGASRSVIITANEQAEYFKVMLAALKEFDKDLADKTVHLSHGFVSLSTGKMSSRTGNVYTGLDAIVDIDRQIEKTYPQASKETRNAAIKYDFLKHRLGSNIVYDVESSFSLEGKSGPYLQYSHARAASILAKSDDRAEITDLQPGERSLARKISEYPEVVDKATKELMPHHICTYLYELAQSFNSFYEHNRVVGDDRQAPRLALVANYTKVLKSGLALLGISAPDKV